jgi:hypothetical protein
LHLVVGNGNRQLASTVRTRRQFGRQSFHRIELFTNFTTPANVQLRVGGVEESIAVSGESPLVDVQ